MAKMQLHANTPEELCKRLLELDSPKPGISLSDWTKEQKERWMLCGLVSSLQEAGVEVLPADVCQPDRPDFLLCSMPLKKTVGIECVEMVSENLRQVEKLPKDKYPHRTIDLSLDCFRPGAKPFSSDNTVADNTEVPREEILAYNRRYEKLRMGGQRTPQ